MHAKLDKMEKYFEELIIDYLTGNLSDPDIARFLEFVQSDERHRRRFEELSRLYAQSLIPRFETDKRLGTGRRSGGSPHPAAGRRLGGLPVGRVSQLLSWSVSSWEPPRFSYSGLMRSPAFAK